MVTVIYQWFIIISIQKINSDDEIFETSPLNYKYIFFNSKKAQ